MGSGLTFLIMFLVLMTLVAIVPQLLRRFHIPGVVAMMLTGIAIGPNCLDLIGRMNHFLGRGYPTEQLYGIVGAMGMLGLVFLMALAGMEVHLRVLMAERRAVAWLSLLTFLLPCAAGYYCYAVFLPNDTIGKWVYGSLFASHSIGIVFPVIRELRVARTRFGVAILASTVITDIASLVLLAVCVQMKRHQFNGALTGSISLFDHIDPTALGNWFIALFLLVIGVYIVLAVWLTPLLIRPVQISFNQHDDTRLTFFLMGVLLVVFLGELIGVSVIVGAFVAGMAMVRAPGFHDKGRVLHRKIEGAGYGFIIPFLFLDIGMKTDLRVIWAAWENTAIVIVTIVGLVVSKVFSGWLAMRLSNFDHKRALCAGLMTVPQLSATLAAAAVALELRMISEAFFNAIVCLSIATTLPIPTLVKLLIIKCHIKFDRVDEQIGDLLPRDPEEDLV